MVEIAEVHQLENLLITMHLYFVIIKFLIAMHSTSCSNCYVNKNLLIVDFKTKTIVAILLWYN